MSAERIKAVIASVARLPVERIDDRARLADIGLGTSIGISILKTRLREELGHETDALTWRSRIEDVVRGVGREQSAPVTPRGPAPLPIPQVGIDLQEISALPEWPDPFYPDHFTDGEIARARQRPDWRQHLCGVWCAKEAVRKASAALAALPFRALEIDADASGKPVLRVLDPSVSEGAVSISITHSTSSAAAIALALSIPP